MLADHGDVFGIVNRELGVLGVGKVTRSTAARALARRASKSRIGQNMRRSMIGSLRRTTSLSYTEASGVPGALK